YGWMPCFVEGSDPESMHQAMAATLDHAVAEIRRIQTDQRGSGIVSRPRWPAIVLRSPKGWSAPREAGGHRLEGCWRAHQVPLPDVKKDSAQLHLLESWMREQKPDELFDTAGRLIPELREMSPKGTRRMSASPHANGGMLKRSLRLPDFRSFA